MFKNQKQFKEFIYNVRCGRYTPRNVDVVLKTLSHKVIRKIGYKIIECDYDGINDVRIIGKKIYFDNMLRWQKEFFIKQNLYSLIR